MAQYFCVGRLLFHDRSAIRQYITNIAKMAKAMIRDHFPPSLPPPELLPEDFLYPLKNWSNMMKSRSGCPNIDYNALYLGFLCYSLCFCKKTLPCVFHVTRIIPGCFKMFQWRLYHIFSPHKHSFLIISLPGDSFTNSSTGDIG